jgi:preprotein translocase subunit SecB
MPTTHVPLEVESYYVREWHLTTNSEYDYGRPAVGELDVDYGVFDHPDDSSRFQVVMSVSVSLDEQRANNEPYAMSLQLNGFFRFKENIDSDAKVGMVFSNAVPILYGIARGAVGQLTAISFNGPVMLPPFNFVELTKRKAEAAALASGSSADSAVSRLE